MASERTALPPGVPPLSALYLYISGACNLPCRHCWISPAPPAGAGSRLFLGMDHLRSVVEQARPLGLVGVKLTGGEPLLHPDFREIVEYLCQAGLPVTLETNGTLIDSDCATLLKHLRNVRFVSVSLDGANATTHEELRVLPGSFEKALNGIRELVKVGIRPQVICTLHKGNVSEVGAVVALAEQLGCGSVKFNHVQRVGRGEGFGEAQGLDLREIIETYRSLESDVIPKVGLAVHFDVPMAFKSIGSLLRTSGNTCGVREILGVLSNGALSLCGIGVSVPELVFGHLDRDALYDVWVGNPTLAALREAVPFGLQGICGECLPRGLCLGMCIADNYHRAKKFSGGHWFCTGAAEIGLFPASRRKGSVDSCPTP